ncbi:acid-soluble spore protein N [Aquibacillus koreensis]|uniref:Small, acid-soluble spore protein N n=1 Tax=Aquibacillus koreensis TaxID=279446 RepID=A0A9X3WMC7_9BACI|nr:acid-soluble spore protein N [Aquibacillus koreensis]MCT2536386.1 acid-soluble spore protein N [Aquibacillus koreensis]MDC3421263.1 acid-soluble spore protein N [Aquibacillus koreensis]
MSNPKRKTEEFRPDHLGTQPRKARANKGKKMANKSNEQPQYIQTKGE